MLGRSNGQLPKKAPVVETTKGFLGLRHYQTSHVTAASGTKTTLATGTLTKNYEMTKIIVIISGEIYTSAGVAILGAQITNPLGTISLLETKTNSTSSHMGVYETFSMEGPAGDYGISFYISGSGGTATASPYCTRSLVLLEV